MSGLVFGVGIRVDLVTFAAGFSSFLGRFEAASRAIQRGQHFVAHIQVDSHSRLVIQKRMNKTLMATAISRCLKSESVAPCHS